MALGQMQIDGPVFQALMAHQQLDGAQVGAFSVPHALVPLMWQNQRRLFALLFEGSAGTLLEVAADPKHLGAQAGLLAVLLCQAALRRTGAHVLHYLARYTHRVAI